MRSHRPFIAAVAALGLAAAALAAPPALKCSQVDVTSPAEPGATAKKGFSATRTVDLVLTLEFKDKTAAGHLAHLRLFAPDGNLYTAMSLPIAASDAQKGTRRVPGYSRPMKEKALREIKTSGAASYAVDFVFPVGGTDIVRTGLYGGWRVEAYLDDATQPCARATSFDLRQ
jgi:hypothetical protein